MRLYLLLAIISFLYTSSHAQDQFLGKSKADVLAEISAKSSEAVDSKQYPLIKETLKIEGIERWDAPATVYFFFDSSDHVCRMHYMFENLPAKSRQNASDEVKGKVKSIQDLSDKKLTVYSGQDKTVDYMLTWSKSKPQTYYLLTIKDYKQRMLNYLVRGGKLPEDGIFTPKP